MTKNQALALLMEMHWNCKHYKGGYDDPKRNQKAEALTMAMTALKHWDMGKKNDSCDTSGNLFTRQCVLLRGYRRDKDSRKASKGLSQIRKEQA